MNYVENKVKLWRAGEMIRRQHDRDLKEKLSAAIKTARRIILETKNDYPNMNSWDCGRQDAYYDKLDKFWSEFEILKGAYQLSKGKARILKRALKIALGEL